MQPGSKHHSRLHETSSRAGSGSETDLFPACSGKAPLSWQQSRSWLLERLGGGPSVSVHSLRFQLEGPVETTALDRAWRRAADRHRILSSCFGEADGIPWQMDRGAQPSGVSHLDWSSFSESERYNRAAEIEEASRLSLDVSAGALIRAHLARLGRDRHLLLVSAHSLAFDPLSWIILSRDLALDLQDGSEADGLHRPSRYLDFAAWQRAHSEPARLDGQLAFWEQWRRRQKALGLPLVGSNSRPENCDSVHRFLVLPANVAQPLERRAAEFGCDLSCLMLAAWQSLLSHSLGRQEGQVALWVSGRRQQALSGMVGPVADPLPIDIDLRRNPSFSQLLDQVRRKTDQALANADVPYAMLEDHLGGGSGAVRRPLAQSGLGLWTAEERHWGKARLGLLTYRPPLRFPLELSLLRRSSDLQACISADGALVSQRRLERLARGLSSLVAMIADGTDGSIRQLVQRSNPDRRPLESGWLLPRAERSEQEREGLQVRNLEQVLLEHPRVREAAVEVRLDGQGRRRRIAYVQPGPAESSWDGERAMVESWQSAFDAIYRRPRPQADADLDTVGWDSGYSGSPIPSREMRQWLDATIEQIRRAGSFQRVLEIGCGTGMVLLGLESEVEAYWGLDFSKRALERVGAELTRRQATHVRLMQRRAEDLRGVPIEAFDLAILNSTVQYFPATDYLFQVLQATEQRLAPGGSIFLGDLRHFQLLPTYFASVRLNSLPDWLGPNEARELIDGDCRREDELAVDPAFLMDLVRDLDRVRQVEIHLKAGDAGNELMSFRYDAILRTASLEMAQAEEWLDWHGLSLTFDALEKRLASPNRGVFGVCNVPDARLAGENALLDWIAQPGDCATLGSLRRNLARRAPRQGLRPSQLRELADRYGWRLTLSPAPGVRDGSFDAGFSPQESPQRPIAMPSCLGSDAAAGLAACNDPLRGRRLSGLIPALKRYAYGKLPIDQVPNDFVQLQSLPRSENGDVDRSSLPEPLPSSDPNEGFIPPRTPCEARLAEIWQELLNLDAVGVEDDFFRLGGSSPLLLQTAARIRSWFDVEVSLRQLLENPRLEMLAEVVEGLMSAE